MQVMLSLTIMLLLSLDAFAANHLLMVGGGGEGKDGWKRPHENNIFYGTFKDNGNLFASNGWDVQMLYDGTDDEIGFLKKGLKNKSTSVNEASKQNLLDALDHAINSYPAGDQLLLSIDTHGGADGTIAFSKDGKLMTQSLNDPDIQNRLGKLKDKGVKLAFTSDACFSGQSIDAFKQYGCVLTAQASNSVSYNLPVATALGSIMRANDFTGFDLSTPGTTRMGDHKITMSEAYMLSISQAQGFSFPQLSATDQGRDLPEKFLALSTYADEESAYKATVAPTDTYQCLKEDVSSEMSYASDMLALSKTAYYKTIQEHYSSDPKCSKFPRKLIDEFKNESDALEKKQKDRTDTLNSFFHQDFGVLGKNRKDISAKFPEDPSCPKKERDGIVYGALSKNDDFLNLGLSSMPSQDGSNTSIMGVGDGYWRLHHYPQEPLPETFKRILGAISPGASPGCIKAFQNAFKSLSDQITVDRASYEKSLTPDEAKQFAKLSATGMKFEKLDHELKTTNNARNAITKLNCVRQYQFMMYRNAHANDPAVKACDDFVLKTY